jgi:hypothetical protein
MGVLRYLTVALCIVWAIPEFGNIIRKRSKEPSPTKDRRSLLVVMEPKD